MSDNFQFSSNEMIIVRSDSAIESSKPLIKGIASIGWVISSELIGLNNILFVLTSDHGGLPLPEYIKKNGGQAGRINKKHLQEALDAIEAMKRKWPWVSVRAYTGADSYGTQEYRNGFPGFWEYPHRIRAAREAESELPLIEGATNLRFNP